MSSEEILYLELFQPFAQYRNPFTFYYAQSYPLPPRSMIIGMLQNATNRFYDETFWSLKVSIHGGFESTFWNYQNMIKGDVGLMRYKGNIELWNQKIPLYGNNIKSQRYPIYQQELFNGHLFIFIKGEESLINVIEESLQEPKKVLSLGRSEDIIFIKRIKKTEKINSKTVKRNIWLKYPMYILQQSKDGKFPIKNEKYPVFSIPTKVMFKNNGKSIKTKGELTKKTQREAHFKPIIYTGYDYAVYLNDEVEVKEYLIGRRTFKIPVNWGWISDD